jgi:hypothetical protein
MKMISLYLLALLATLQSNSLKKALCQVVQKKNFYSTKFERIIITCEKRKKSQLLYSQEKEDF